MLILIPGITGNVGTHLAEAAFSAGHGVRGLGRSPDKLPAAISSKLESFVTTSSYADISALDKACAGVDAIIVAYAPDQILTLDGQLLLLRAAERAGIKRFHSSSWNGDWSEMTHGVVETYNAFISFHHHARLTSPIKPLFVFTGVLAKTFFAVPGAGALEEDKSFWVRKAGKERKINVIGTGEEVFDWCTEADAAAFSVALVTSEWAEKGGFYRFCSQAFCLREVKETYLKVYPEAEVEWNLVPVTVEQLEGFIAHSRKEAIEKDNVRETWQNWIGSVYGVLMIKGEMALGKLDTDKFPDVPRTSLEKFMREASYI